MNTLLEAVPLVNLGKQPLSYLAGPPGGSLGTVYPVERKTPDRDKDTGLAAAFMALTVGESEEVVSCNNANETCTFHNASISNQWRNLTGSDRISQTNGARSSRRRSYR